MKQWNFRPHDSCPFCLHPHEDTEHVIQCQHADALQLWQDQFQKIEESLTKWDTEVTLKVAICQDLQAWRQKNHLTSINYLPQEIQKAVSDMRRIGYDRILEGLLPHSVIAVQQEYYDTKESRRSGKAWGKKVYTLFWNTLMALWAGRNEQLHKTDRIHELEGLSTLKSAIKAEFDLGLHRLPACEFSIYFSVPYETLCQRHISALRTWLHTIRLGRELHGGHDIIIDEYSVNGPFRSWLGLHKWVLGDFRPV